MQAPWSDADIGGPALVGSASEQNGVDTIYASGNDIWNQDDEFHYVYRPMTGDGTIIARVVSQQDTDPWSKAGVMMRQSLDGGSADAGVYVTPGNGVDLQWRPSLDAGGDSSGNIGVNAGAPYWVMLVRSGSTFTASASPDGQNWTDIGSITIAMTSQIYVGLALSAHDDGLINRTTFDNISVSSPAAAQVVSPAEDPTAGTPFGLTVAAEDQFGNVLNSFHGSVSIGLSSGPAGGVLNGLLTMNATNGTASSPD